MSEMTKLNLAYLQNLQNSDQGPLGFIYPQSVDNSYMDIQKCVIMDANMSNYDYLLNS